VEAMFELAFILSSIKVAFGFRYEPVSIKLVEKHAIPRSGPTILLGHA
jgi:hypothetical protein